MPSFYANLRSALSAPIGNRQTSTPDDLVRTRRNFSRLGRYDGDTELSVLDRGLDNTIRAYQREKGLKQDGIMNPGGETERALNRDLGKMLRPAELRQPLSTPPVRLSATVGNNRENQSADVKQVQRSLGGLGLASESKLYEPSGILDRETLDTLQLFQKASDLRVDGYMNPGGETEAAMNAALHRLSAPSTTEEDNENKGEDEKDDKDKEDENEPDCSDQEQALEDAEEELRLAREALDEIAAELSDIETKIAELKARIQKKQKCGPLEEAMYKAELERDNKRAVVDDLQGEVDRIQAELDNASTLSDGIGFAASILRGGYLGPIYNGGKYVIKNMNKYQLRELLQALQTQLIERQAELDAAQQKLDKAKTDYWACQNGSEE